MITRITYNVTGAEPLDAWGMVDDVQIDGTQVMIHAASGYRMLDVLLNGYSKSFEEVLVDESQGRLVFQDVLNRGDIVHALFTSLPRFLVSAPAMVDFDSADFSSDDFL